MNSLFKDNLIIDNFSNLIQDKKFTVKKYWFKKVYLTNLIKLQSKIQVKTAKQILEMYNDYLNLNQDLEDIFNINYLINYSENQIEFKFNQTPSKEITFKFIERILSISTQLNPEISL